MQDNAKYIPAKVANPAILKYVIMSGNSKVLKQRDVSNNHVKMELCDNAVLDSVASTDRGLLRMSGNAYYSYKDDTALSPLVLGTLEMKDNAKIVGAVLTVHGDVELVGNFNLSAGSRTIYGKHRIASPDEVNKPEVSPMKKTW